ncbi:MAG: rRNA methylase [Parcubacteria group bacterium GW2011_GWA1_47_11]|nr:MAG: rRNA methylase [Parcubacteria group bacterium GW2011_GWA1_47_11]
MLSKSNKTIYLVLHNIRSAYNVGSIFRTADGAGVAKIYLCGYTPIPDEPKVIKTALGAEGFVSWEKHRQTGRLLNQLKKQGTDIVALELDPKSKGLFDYDFASLPSKSLAIVVGHERKGLTKNILSYVDDIIEIPMHGKKESLNVAVATGVVLYQIIEKSFNN